MVWFYPYSAGGVRAAQAPLNPAPLSRQPFQAKDLQRLRPVLYRHGGKQVHTHVLAHLYECGAVEQDIVVRGVSLQARGDINHVTDGSIVLHTSLTQITNYCQA